MIHRDVAHFGEQLNVGVKGSFETGVMKSEELVHMVEYVSCACHSLNKFVTY